MPAHVPLRADKSEEGAVFVFATGRTGERHGDDELHVPTAIVDRASVDVCPRPYKYLAEASLDRVLLFSLNSQTLARRPISLAAVWGHRKHRREALELRLASSYLLADARLPGSSEPTNRAIISPPVTTSQSTFAVDWDHLRPRHQALRAPGELLNLVEYLVRLIMLRSDAASITCKRRRCLCSPELLR
jgi:hypothetical protein